MISVWGLIAALIKNVVPIACVLLFTYWLNTFIGDWVFPDQFYPTIFSLSLSDIYFLKTKINERGFQYKIFIIHTNGYNKTYIYIYIYTSLVW